MLGDNVRQSTSVRKVRRHSHHAAKGHLAGSATTAQITIMQKAMEMRLFRLTDQARSLTRSWPH
ncbi:hypothetical protein CFBP5875_23410 (plasmid) [Agrobacterium pusense]|nr:hypothetical protein CFBP5875_23410 [Agrobacterium pusense]